jgi:cytochrome oxidase assembly protein ShyY1
VHKIQFRRVTATGTYDDAHTVLARTKVVDGQTGYYVVTPFHTATATLLVARGFVADPTAAPAPSGQLTITARIQPGETKADKAAALGNGQVESINPADEARRLSTPVFNAYAELVAGQPGGAGLKPLPAPDLGNPAGGAVEPQHVAYIIQWYLFALLALAAPIAMARSETKHRETRDFDTTHGEDGTAAEPVAQPTPEAARAAKLADRYGKPIRH